MKSRSLLQGFVWNAIDLLGRQGVDFITTLVLARLLNPQHFGLIGMMTVFFALAQSLMDSGFKQALIQTNEPTKIQYDSVFWLNVVLGFFLYGIIYLSAPAIGSFYGQFELVELIRWTALIVPLNSFQLVQSARMSRELNFKLQTQITIPAILISGIIAIILAYSGFGVWSLTAKMIVLAFLSSAFYWLLGKYQPAFQFSWVSIKPLFKFGYKLTLAGLLNTSFNNLYFAIIGKLFSAEMLGFYTQAKKMVNIPAQNSTSILQKVTFPYLSRIKDQPEVLINRFRIIMHLAVFMAAPVMIVLSVWSEEIVRFLLGDKWAFSAKILNIVAFTGLLYPIHAINLNILKVMGRSDLYLRLEVYKKGMILVAIIIGMQFGIFGLLIAQLCTSTASLLFNTYYTSKFLRYSVINQLKDIFVYILLALVTSGIYYIIQIQIGISNYWWIGIIVVLITYLHLNFFFKFLAFSVLWKSYKAKRIIIDEQ